MKSLPYTFLLPVEMISEIDRLADAEDRSRSSVVRRLIGEWLERQKGDGGGSQATSETSSDEA